MYRSINLILLVFTFNVAAKKKLEIHKCVKRNGTIIYQEEPCIKKTHKRKIGSKFKAKSNILNRKPTVARKILPIKQVPKINFKDLSIKTVTNSAKGFDFSFQILNKWQVTNKVYNNKLLHMKFIDFTPNAKISLMMDFIHSEGKTFSSYELEELVYLIGSRYVEGSNEKSIFPYKLNVKNGKGVMTTLTNSKMSSHYKFITRGIIFKSGWLIHFTLLSNNQKSQGHKFALKSLTEYIYIK